MTTSASSQSSHADPDLSCVQRDQPHAPPLSWSDLLPVHRISVVAKTPLLITLGVYLSGGTFQLRTVGATLGLASLLWAALYALNESTDLALERGVEVGRSLHATLFTLPLLLCLLAIPLSPLLFFYLSVMTLGQMAYCVPPLRLKRHWATVLLLGGIVNPILRVASGAMWGSASISLPLYLVLACLHLGAALRSRVLLRERDRRLGYRVAPRGCGGIGRLFTCVGLVGSVALCLRGVLPLHFILFALIGIAFSLYAWSSRITCVTQIRKGWSLFVVLALVAVVELLFR